MSGISKHEHRMVICSCGQFIKQCRCMEGHKNVQIIPDGCSKCKKENKKFIIGDITKENFMIKDIYVAEKPARTVQVILFDDESDEWNINCIIESKEIAEKYIELEAAKGRKFFTIPFAVHQEVPYDCNYSENDEDEGEN